MENYKTSGLGKKMIWCAVYFLGVISALDAQFLEDSYIVGSLGANISIQDVVTTNGEATYLYGTYTEEMTLEGFSLSHQGEADAFLIKRVDGIVEWVFFGGSAGSEKAANISINEAQNIIISGAFWNEAIFGGETLISSGSSRAVFVLEITPDGMLVDHHVINGTGQKEIIGTEVIEDEIYLAGSFGDRLFLDNTEVVAQSEKDIYIMKLDGPSGEAWIQNFGIEGKSDPIDFSWQAQNEQFIISGHFNDKISVAEDSIQTNTFDEDLFLAAFTKTGDGKWIRKLGGQFEDFNEAHCSDAEGNIYLTGMYRGIINFEDGTQIDTGGIGNSDSYLIKCDALGNKIWARTIGEAGTEIGSDLVFNDNYIYWLGYYDKAFAIDDVHFDESEGLLNGCFVVFNTFGDLETNLILESNNILAPQGLKAFQGGAILYGEFIGEATFEQTYDAGGNFFGFATTVNLQTVSTTSQQKSTAKVYPNPTSEILFINLGTESKHIALYDIKGTLVYESPMRLELHELNLSNLKDGIYFWKSETGKSGKVLKK